MLDAARVVGGDGLRLRLVARVSVAGVVKRASERSNTGSAITASIFGAGLSARQFRALNRQRRGRRQADDFVVDDQVAGSSCH